jgi:hypothetical protein
MTSSEEKNTLSPPSDAQGINLDRVQRLVADLEQELAKAPADNPDLQDLRKEILTLKNVLGSPRVTHAVAGEELHSVRASLQKMTATIEGEVLKDSPYIAEIGRILGMV